jgi:predicted ATPase
MASTGWGRQRSAEDEMDDEVKPQVPHVILTGGPGAGKTTLLAELAAMGYDTVDESARAVIAERLARGASPRPDALAFAQEILRRDIEKYLNQPRTARWVFFDRALIDALGMLHEASSLSSVELETLLASYPFHPMAFVLPPWEAIYANDSERDQSFADAVDVHARVVHWYRSCAYVLHEVPRLPVTQRAEYVLRTLAASA